MVYIISPQVQLDLISRLSSFIQSFSTKFFLFYIYNRPTALESLSENKKHQFAKNY